MARSNLLGRAMRYVADALAYASVPLLAGSVKRTTNPLLSSMLRGMSYQALGESNADLDYYLRLAVNNPDLYGALSRIADRVGQQDALMVQRRVGDKWVDQADHEFLQLLRRPNSLEPGIKLLRETAWWLNTTGDSYWFLVTDMPGIGPIHEIWQLPSVYVRPRPDRLRISELTGEPIIDYDYHYGGMTLLPGENVVHISLPNLFDYWQGLSPLTSVQESLRSDYNQRSWIADFFGDGKAVPTAIISTAPDVTDPEFDAIQDSIRAEFSKRRRIAVIRGGDLDIQVIQQTMKEMELYAGLEYYGGQMRKALKVPEGLTSATSGAERLAAEIAFARDAIQPMLDFIAAYVSMHVMPYYQDMDGELRCIATDQVPQDRAMEVVEYQAYSGDRTVNENRERQKLPPLKMEGALEMLQPLVADVPVNLIQLASQVVLGGPGGPGAEGAGGPGEGAPTINNRYQLIAYLAGKDPDALAAILSGRDVDTLTTMLTNGDPLAMTWQQQVARHRAVLGQSAPTNGTNGAAASGMNGAPLAEMGPRMSGQPKQEQLMAQLVPGFKSFDLSPDEQEAALAAGINVTKRAGGQVDPALVDALRAVRLRHDE